ncbi:MAG: hypothetical protein HOK06_07195 [Rhodospirillaceae bacterium]|jgi:hypothetical protein|nr:hypothetical protein [Alphaproteobacteria bacterium]MBT4218398.1 hypothetical protein [Rhodospirillaceae bacterium]MBT4463207.1 hypothetical protein [Rhodospirillaceae bacterium]MBT5309121.1 hypothetical protein [Rhodospirillaceae bacterium]MBT6407374.1 hypothetical protein [Rhodospirillaceae bacterium]
MNNTPANKSFCPPRLPLAVTVILALPVILGVIIRVAFADSFELALAIDRDLTQANYALLSGLMVAGIFTVYLAARQVLAMPGALFAAGFYALSPGLLGAVYTSWTSLISLALSAVAFPLLFMVLRSNASALTWLAVLLGIAVQVHPSSLVLAVGVILALVLIPNACRLRHWMAAAITLLVVLSPSLTNGLGSGYINTERFISGLGQNLHNAPDFGLLANTLLTLTGAGTLDTPTMSDRLLTAGAALLLLGIAVQIVRAVARSRPDVNVFKWRRHLVDAPLIERAVLALALIVANGIVHLLFNHDATMLGEGSLLLIAPLALLAAVFVMEAMDHLRTCNTARMIATAALFSAIFIVHGLAFLGP